MALKQLKVSMIFGGSYHTFGTVLEESEIPPNLRKPSYLTEPEEPEDLMEFLEDENDLIDELNEEELPPTRIPSDSRAKHFKPRKKT